MTGGTKFKTCLIISVLLLAMVSSATGKIIFVDSDATGADNGSSWADACKYLQDALADANSGDEIHVAEGIYTPDSNSADPSGSGERTATFQLINGVTIKGSYAGFGEPEPNARDIELYETILSGDLDGNDIDVNNIDVNDLWDFWNEPSRAENSYHVVTGSGTDETAILYGFTITSGNAYNILWHPPMMPDPNNYGGGMYTHSGGATVMNCTFSGNSASHNGGGMYNSSSVLRLVNCTFQANVATDGGGMQNQTSDLTFINCTFRDNTGTFAAGGMGIWDSNATLADCTFSGNIGGYAIGGLHSINSNVKLTNCIFIGNWTPWPSTSGGGSTGGLGISGGKAVVTHCIFKGNSARHGAGMTGDTNLILINCIFSGNSAVHRGGGMLNSSRSAPVMITNCTFSGNSAGEGGGIYNSYRASATITNCTFSGNSARRSGAINNESFSSATLTNCILWDNTAASGPQVDMEKESTLEINYCCIEGGETGIYDPYHGLVWGTGNIDADPCFAEPGYWDPNGTPGDVNDDFWVDGDYHLKSQAGRWDKNDGRWTMDDVTSLCIDAGNPNSPIGLEPFPNGGLVNIGVYGGTAEASKSYFGEPVCETVVAGDINGDCVVNFKDFALMAFHWLEESY